MKRLGSFILLLSMLTLCFALTASADPAENLLPEKSSDFETAADAADTGWTAFNAGSLVLNTDGGASGNNYITIVMEDGKDYMSWYSPAINIYPFIKASGAGEYTITMSVRIDGEVAEDAPIPFGTLIRGSGAADGNSFIIQVDDVNYFATLEGQVADGTGIWTDIECMLYVEEDDIDESDHSWILCMDSFNTAGVQSVSVDNVKIFKAPEATPTPVPTATPVLTPTPVKTANTTPTATAGNTNGLNTTTIILIAAGAVVVIGAVTFFVLKSRKKED